MAHAPVSPEQFTRPGYVMMRPSELAKYAEDRTSDPYQERHVAELAQRISRQGYRAKQHQHWRNDLDSSIHLVHLDDGTSFLNNGNHRVVAMNRIGYDKRVPVRVSDFR